MPAPRKKEKITGRFFVWLLGVRKGIYFADGRSNHPHDVGRHSLGTRDRRDALEQLQRLDLVKAVEFGLADRSVLCEGTEKLLTLEEGRDAYLKHVGRPPTMGGAGKTTLKRYKAVFDKFIPFAQQESTRHWQGVSRRLLEAYGSWLDDQDYASASEYLELTTVKQAMKWLAEEKLIPSSCFFAYRLAKPKGTTTYCFTTEEVAVIVAHCRATPELIWLGPVLVALATTGLRISELASLRWTDVDLDSGKEIIRLTDTRQRAIKAEREKQRSTKSHRDRVLPIAQELAIILRSMPRHADGRVFHGPLGGVLKPDTVRVTLIRDVLEPLSKRFPVAKDGKSFRDGRLHSFRHYFCSFSATKGVTEQVLMSWLGHQDSKMVRHYYHLHDAPSRAHMDRLQFVATPPS